MKVSTTLTFVTGVLPRFGKRTVYSKVCPATTPSEEASLKDSRNGFWSSPHWTPPVGTVVSASK